MRAVGFVVLCILSGCVAPGAEAEAATAQAPASGSALATTTHFAFHSNELLNLHHFLYQCARAEARRGGARLRGRPVAVPELAQIEALDGDEHTAWRFAIDFYLSAAIERDLLFDGRMYAIKVQLAAIDDAGQPWPHELDAEFAAALRRAVPVYRAHFWPAHDAANRRWTAAVVRELGRYEAELTERMAKAYGGAWPRTPMRVDACALANWAGAYTTDAPPHIVLSTTDDDQQGHAALECLVHEASHTDALYGSMRPAINAAFAAHGATPPGDLWHVLIFFTAGETVRRTLDAAGIAGYAHYGDRTGLYGRGPWRAQSGLLAEHWTAYLDGTIDRATALDRIAVAIGG